MMNLRRVDTIKNANEAKLHLEKLNKLIEIVYRNNYQNTSQLMTYLYGEDDELLKFFYNNEITIGAYLNHARILPYETLLNWYIVASKYHFSSEELYLQKLKERTDMEEAWIKASTKYICTRDELFINLKALMMMEKFPTVNFLFKYLLSSLKRGEDAYSFMYGVFMMDIGFRQSVFGAVRSDRNDIKERSNYLSPNMITIPEIRERFIKYKESEEVYQNKRMEEKEKVTLIRKKPIKLSLDDNNDGDTF